MNESNDKRDEVEQLRHEIDTLREAIQYLAFCKQSEPRFAYFDWLVKNGVLGDRQVRFNVVLTTLSARLQGHTLPREPPVPGVSSELLYKAGPPTYQDAKQLLMQVMGISNETTIEELFVAMKSQGMHDDLIALWEQS